jgi:excisionase family DNA binding protein
MAHHTLNAQAVSGAQATAISSLLHALFPEAALPTEDAIRTRLPSLLAGAPTPTAPTSNGETELLDVPQVLAALKISRPSLWRLVRDGRLTPTRIGRRVLISRADLERLVRRCRATKPARKEA